jgi:hypothetical protein
VVNEFDIAKAWTELRSMIAREIEQARGVESEGTNESSSKGRSQHLFSIWAIRHCQPGPARDGQLKM